MCRENKELFLVLLFGVLFSFIAGVLQAGEPGYWYLISETELWSIEQYKEKSEQERQIWLLQVQNLRVRAENLEIESGNLNNQLTNQRERERMLEQSFNEYESASLTTISQKNGEIADKDSKILKLTQDNAKMTKTLFFVSGILCLILTILIFKFVLWVKGGGVTSLLKR